MSDLPYNCEIDIGPYGVGVIVGADLCGGEYNCHTGTFLDADDLRILLAAVEKTESSDD